MSILSVIINIIIAFTIIYILSIKKISKKKWNKGYCNCGYKWSTYIENSLGRIGYRCTNEACTNFIIIDYKMTSDDNF